MTEKTTIDARLAELGLELPPASVPRGSYLPVVRSGNYLQIAGQGPRLNGELLYAGRVGADLSVDDGQRAAQLCALNILSHIGCMLDGDFSRVVRIVRVAGVVRCDADFTEHATVLNGASDLFFAVLGEAGRHARIATGANALPSGMAVEVEATVEVV
ncbi:RidA family protein [Burkholderia contaminans]|uniref:RidA family protein n=1 Tax=Burkholderia contaminans TaxID=488447 RepID=UPI000F55E03A|nr:RidA family protein [Burkholderia contaminans]ELK6462018.1 RidA family protein [Burkholderia contaminans]MCA7889296.1 RidA family protein [Burkholderia contaminans]RQT23581.1 RidA family protein [Burkholderia contaminans]